MLAGFMKQGDTALNARLYRALYRIRRVEEEIARVYPTDKIKSPVHLSIGQEGVAVGACEALEPHDVVFGSYRGHAMYLAKGGDLRRMLAQKGPVAASTLKKTIRARPVEGIEPVEDGGT